MYIRWRGLALPSQVVAHRETLTGQYGQFSVEPFQRGFGTTIGNSLRRILLSSLEGSAVTQIKIRGVQHEFQPVEGVKEDITDVVLNIKSLVVKNHSDAARVITVEANKAGVVKASDIRTDADVEIVNRDLVICTLTKDVELFIEMVVENGRGYSPSSDRAKDETEQGIIPIDAVFSPVLRVRCDVEETRVGQQTNYDKLNIEIWTDASITPEMALIESAKILRKHLNPFVQYQELGPKVHPTVPQGSVNPELERKLDMAITDLKLSVRAMNCLHSEKIMKVRDLVEYTEDRLLEVRNFGETTLNEVKHKLAEQNLSLGMRPPTGAAS